MLERDLSNFITEFLKPLATSFIIFPGLTFRRINFLGLSFPGLSSPELLIIYTNYPALVHKHKTITFDMVGRGLENKPLKNISKSSEQTKKRRKTSSRQITAHIFWSFLNGMARNQTGKPEFSVFHVNGKYPTPGSLILRRTSGHVVSTLTKLGSTGKIESNYSTRARWIWDDW